MRGFTRFLRHWQNWLGLFIVAGFVIAALAAPALAPPGPKDTDPAFHLIPNFEFIPLPPDNFYPLGTLPFNSQNHVSVFNNLVWGARGALSFGLVVALLTATLGVLLGAIGGYAGGWINTLILRITDAFLTFPTVVAVVLISQLVQYLLVNAGLLYVGPNNYRSYFGHLTGFLGWLENTNPALIAFVLFSWMPYARLTNSMVLRLRQVAFIEATRALGASPARIILRHLIPNAISPSVVLLARDIGGLVLLQATLTYIGLPAQSEWGEALHIASRWVIGPGGNPLARWWVFVPTTVTIVLFGIGWNLLGDGLNDWLNPRSA